MNNDEYDITYTVLTQRDWSDALMAQNGVNLSGIAKSFAELTTKLWQEAHACNKGTGWVNRHPLSVLYVDKMADLAGAGSYENTSNAYEFALQMARKR